MKCVITKSEIASINAAMGMSKGHWFKCPNGHVYAIGDCGGATVESKCNECGARIGGGNHQLRSDNTFAPEMDGAEAPAWPGMAAAVAPPQRNLAYELMARRLARAEEVQPQRPRGGGGGRGRGRGRAAHRFW